MFCQFLYDSRFKIDGPDGSKGFSLIELIVVIAIVAIVGGIGYPPLMKIRNNTRTRGVASDIFSSFRHAQSVAVKQNVGVCLQFRAAGTYLAFVDDGTGAGAADDCIQYIDPADPEATDPTKSEVTLFDNRVEPGTSILADFTAGYNSRGMPWNNVIGNVTVQNNSDPNLQYRINLSLAGRADIKASTNGGGTWN